MALPKLPASPSSATMIPLAAVRDTFHPPLRFVKPSYEPQWFVKPLHEPLLSFQCVPDVFLRLLVWCDFRCGPGKKDDLGFFSWRIDVFWMFLLEDRRVFDVPLGGSTCSRCSSWRIEGFSMRKEGRFGGMGSESCRSVEE